jgi:hypothetical protein
MPREGHHRLLGRATVGQAAAEAIQQDQPRERGQLVQEPGHRRVLPGAECRLDGQWIICQTALVEQAVNEPNDFHFACADTYETFTDVRNGIRWYNADGLLVKRFVTQDVAGSAHGEFTLSAPGYGVISHVAGLDLTDGIHHGVFRVVEDPQVAAELCAALTA